MHEGVAAVLRFFYALFKTFYALAFFQKKIDNLAFSVL